MEEFLIFFREAGTTSDGRYIYQLDFSTTPDSAWGEGWADVSILTPGIVPDEGIVSSGLIIKTDINFITADRSTCFTMQDCIDDIIPLAYHLDGDDTLIFRFGNALDDVIMVLDEYGIEYEEIETRKDESTNIIDNLINSLSGTGAEMEDFENE